jgi:hypothetical protein
VGEAGVGWWWRWWGSGWREDPCASWLQHTRGVPVGCACAWHARMDDMAFNNGKRDANNGKRDAWIPNLQCVRPLWASEPFPNCMVRAQMSSHFWELSVACCLVRLRPWRQAPRRSLAARGSHQRVRNATPAAQLTRHPCSAAATQPSLPSMRQSAATLLCGGLGTSAAAPKPHAASPGVRVLIESTAWTASCSSSQMACGGVAKMKRRPCAASGSAPWVRVRRCVFGAV